MRWTFAAFWAQVFVSLILMLVRPDTTAFLMDALATSATLTGAVHVGYYGKAGAENWRKIGNLTYDDDEAEG